jgi:hypothetical protein
MHADLFGRMDDSSEAIETRRVFQGWTQARLARAASFSANLICNTEDLALDRARTPGQARQVSIIWLA